jgi:prepilin-type N-terminal cleavage/methylation domain-containing protein
MKKQSAGFTLIELLLVLAIIGIISAIAIPALLGQRENARQKATQGAASAIKGELAAYAEGLRKSGVTPTASGVIGGVSTMAQYTYPGARNAYIPTLSPYKSAAAAVNGEVGLLTTAATGPDGQTYEAIQVSWKHLATSGVTVVSIDQ